MFGMGIAELIVFALIALVIFVVPAVAILYLVWQAMKRRK
jgi:hypothetical protein